MLYWQQRCPTPACPPPTHTPPPPTQGTSHDQRDLLYLLAVGRFRQRKYLEARRTLRSLMEVHPDFRQADSLLEACESEIIKDGLVGVGAGAAILGVVGAIAVAALRKR